MTREEEEEIESDEEDGNPVELPPKTTETEEEQGEEEVIEEEVIEEEPKPFKTFKDEAEYNAWAEEEKAKIQAAKPAATPEQVDRIFEEGYKPKDWNDFALQLLANPNAQKILRERLAPETAREIQKMTQQERAELEDINAGFDREYDGLAKSGKVPARNTEDGKKINEAITAIGAAYGQSSMTKAYELWAKIPLAQGGGLDYIPPAKKKLNDQKRRSGLIGKPRGNAINSGKKERKYAELHNKNLDDLVDEEDV